MKGGVEFVYSTNKMNCHNVILNYIQNCEKNEPIFIEDIKKYIMQFYKEEEKEKIFNNVKEILNRLSKDNIIKTAYKGIYYIPKTNIFGEVPLANSKIIRYKYLVDKFGNIKGYITGAILFNKVGLTTQVPNIIEIVTNECKNNNKYKNKYLNVVIRRSKIEINNENYKYLQLIDLLENRDNIYIEVDTIDEIIYDFIQKNDLNFEKIIKYARETNSKTAIEKMIILAR